MPQGVDIPLLVARLWNWGAWARSDADGYSPPDGRCLNSIWDNWNPFGAGRDEGWGEAESAPASEEVDELDAEAVDCLVMQLAPPSRGVLVQRFVLQVRLPWQQVDPAVRAVGDLIEENQRVVDKMEGRL